MSIKKSSYKTNQRPKKVFLVDKYVCRYMKEEWFIDAKKDKLREYGRLYGIHYHTVEKIVEEDGYNIPLHTLNIICFNKGVSLSEFFKLVERKYGNKIDDSYVLKYVDNKKLL
jgi:hypothetical protein